MADAASERLRDHIRRLELDAERLRSQMSTGDLTNRCWARAEAARANVKQLHEKGKSTMQIRKHYLLVDLDLTEAEGENSATEAWMKRAASRNLHVPWESKLHDFGPEAERLAQALTEPVLLARGWDFSQCASDPAVGKEGSATVLSSPESIGETSCLSLPQVHTTGSAPSAPPPPSAVAVAASTSPEPGRNLGEESGATPTSFARHEGSEDALGATYKRCISSTLEWAGWTRHSVWEGQVSVRWASGHEHHGTFEAGRAHGAGMHIFPDGARLSCCFARGRPVGAGSLMDNTGAYYDVEYGHDLPGDMHTPGNEEAEGQDSVCALLSVGTGTRARAAALSWVQTTEPLSKAYYSQYGAACACLRVPVRKHGEDAGTSEGSAGGSVTPPVNARTKTEDFVCGSLVWARPVHADLPLWNADEVSGNILVTSSGPAGTPACVPWGLVLFHAQAAGAKAVILVNNDASLASLPSFVPAITEGPVPRGIYAGPPDRNEGGILRDVLPSASEFISRLDEDEMHVRAKIPAGLVLHESRKMLLEGLQVHLRLPPASVQEKKIPGAASVMCSPTSHADTELAAGCIEIPIQRRGSVLSKEEADALLVEFKTSREDGHRLDTQRRRPRNLFWDQFFGEVLDGNVMREVDQGLGIPQLRSAIKSMSLGRLWHGAGAAPAVWSVRGAPPFSVDWIMETGDVALHLDVMVPARATASASEGGMTAGKIQARMNSVSFSSIDPVGTWGEEEHCRLNSAGGDLGRVSVALLVSVDASGFHIASCGEVHALFAHRVAWDSSAATRMSVKAEAEGHSRVLIDREPAQTALLAPTGHSSPDLRAARAQVQALSGGSTQAGPQKRCIHGVPIQEGGKCRLCEAETIGCHVPEHCPWLPCLPGHGPSWLWSDGAGLHGDKSARAADYGKVDVANAVARTGDSTGFFRDLELAPGRACKMSHWPLERTFTVQQDMRYGYHVVSEGAVAQKGGCQFAGWLLHGLPHGVCSMRWSDGSEFHGEFEHGDITGYGCYIWPEGDQLRAIFQRALPLNGYYFPPQNACRRLADFSMRLPGTPPWEMTPDMRLPFPPPASMLERPLAPYVWAKADGLAVARVMKCPQSAATQHEDSVGGHKQAHSGCGVHVDLRHMQRVSASLVWARPRFADQPLWNAADVRGKIAVISRGPWPPAPEVSYAEKIYYCQEAGAVGVVVVDWENRFGTAPGASNGPIWEGGPVLEMKIPVLVTPASMAGALQEGAIHTMLLMKKQPPGMGKKGNGRFIGFVVCERQESKRTMSKESAEALMTEFLSQRRGEREKESTLLRDNTEVDRGGKTQADGLSFVTPISPWMRIENARQLLGSALHDAVVSLAAPQMSPAAAGGRGRGGVSGTSRDGETMGQRAFTPPGSGATKHSWMKE